MQLFTDVKFSEKAAKQNVQLDGEKKNCVAKWKTPLE